MSKPTPIQQPKATRMRARPGFTMVEIMIVIAIAAVIIAAISGGGFAALRYMKIQKTKVALIALDQVSSNYKDVQEVYPVFYVTTLGAAPNYWPPTVANDGLREFLRVTYYVPSPDPPGTLDLSDPATVAGDRAIGDARGMLTALGPSVFDSANAIVYDAWNHPIFVKTAGTTVKRGLFQSAGPDGIPNNEDDITSAGGSQ